MQQLPISDPARITSFYHAFSSHMRDEALLQELLLPQATNSSLKRNIWEDWVDDRALDLKVACKQGRLLSPSSSWKVPAQRAHPPSPAPQLQPHFSPSHSAESELEAEDMAARAWASISVQQLPPLVDVPPLACLSQPVNPWDGNVDALLGGEPCSAACAQTGTAAYRGACQQLAWSTGRLLTWRAALTDSEQAQQQQQQQSVTVAAAPVVLEAKWDYVFTCLEAAARLGKCLTYAMAVAA